MAAGRLVRAWGVAVCVIRVNVNNDGSFEIPDIPDGPARLLATLNSESYYLKAIRVNGEDVAGRSIHFVGGQAVSGAEVILALDAAELRGRVAAADLTAP